MTHEAGPQGPEPRPGQATEPAVAPSPEPVRAVMAEPVHQAPAAEPAEPRRTLIDRALRRRLPNRKPAPAEAELVREADEAEARAAEARTRLAQARAAEARIRAAEEARRAPVPPARPATEARARVETARRRSSSKAPWVVAGIAGLGLLAGIAYQDDLGRFKDNLGRARDNFGKDEPGLATTTQTPSGAAAGSDADKAKAAAGNGEKAKAEAEAKAKAEAEAKAKAAADADKAKAGAAATKPGDVQAQSDGSFKLQHPDQDGKTVERKMPEGFTPDPKLHASVDFTPLPVGDLNQYSTAAKARISDGTPGGVGYNYDENDYCKTENFKCNMQLDMFAWRLLQGQEVSVPGIGTLKGSERRSVVLLIMNVADDVLAHDKDEAGQVTVKRGFTATGRIFDGNNLQQNEKNLTGHWLFRQRDGTPEKSYVGITDSPENARETLLVTVIRKQWGNNPDGSKRYEYQLVRSEVFKLK